MSDHFELRFPRPCIERVAGPHLGGLPTKFMAMADDTARHMFGKSALPGPSVIELTPVIDTDKKPLFIMQMWHQTEGPNPGVLQRHDVSFTEGLDGEDAVMRTETGHEYPLTTREAFLLQAIVEHAATHDMLDASREQ